MVTEQAPGTLLKTPQVLLRVSLRGKCRDNRQTISDLGCEPLLLPVSEENAVVGPVASRVDGEQQDLCIEVGYGGGRDIVQPAAALQQDD